MKKSTGAMNSRIGMGCFVLFSLLANLYLILTFHRSQSLTSNISSGLDYFGIEPPASSSSRRRTSLRGGNGNSSEELQAEVNKLRIQLRRKDVKLKRTEKDFQDEEREVQRLREELEAVEKQNDMLTEENDVHIGNVGGDNGTGDGTDNGNEQQRRRQEVRRKQQEIRYLNNELARQTENASREIDIALSETVALKDQLFNLQANHDNEDSSSSSASNQNQNQISGGERPWPKPALWENMGFHDIREHFYCKVHAHDQTKQLPTLEDWNLFRNVYKEVVDPNATFDEGIPPTEGYTFKYGDRPLPPPYYAKLSDDGRGRGLFASRLIKKGELVQDGNKSDFTFPDAMSWKKYVLALPRKKACDVIDWTWTQRAEEGGPFKIFSAMNISILLNGGDVRQVNIMPRSEVSSMMYATRDIQKDEELLTDYYIYDTVWPRVGLASKGEVWSEDESGLESPPGATK